MNRLYPVFLKMEGVPCLVVGGGTVALRKVQTLIDCGAQVTVVSPTCAEDLGGLAEQGAIRWLRRGFRSEDLERARLVIAATDDEAVNRAVASEADGRGVPCNVVDRPELCSFHVPAVVARGDLKIAVSTNGKCPAVAALVRRILEEEFGEEYARVIERFAQLREEARRRWPDDASGRMAALKRLAEGAELADALRRRDPKKLEAILESWTLYLLD